MNHFQSLGLAQPLVEAVTQMGFEEPTTIQSIVIPQLLEQKIDLIALAQTGTGKTAAFGLPLIQSIDLKAKHPQALILAPTRELALQITGELEQYAVRLRGLRVLTVYGGSDIYKQIRALQSGVHVVVATPGRLKDLLGRREVDLSRLQVAVLDEADEMLNMGFRPDLEHILAATPEDKQTWLFSATMSEDVQKLSRRYLTSPLEVSAGDRNAANEDIEHQYIVLDRSEKYDALRSLLDHHEDFYGLLFCRTRHETQKLAKKLTQDRYPADALHGDMSQKQRERVMNRFRNRKLRVLVATDVAARGIDVEDLTHVLHYNIPDDIAFYTHRSGRTGRAGKQGTSLALLGREDLYQLRQIEKKSKVKFAQVEVPRGADKSEKYRQHLLSGLQRIRSADVRPEVEAILPELCREMAGLSKEELIARLASQALNRLDGPTRTAPTVETQKETKPRAEARKPKLKTTQPDRKKGEKKRWKNSGKKRSGRR